MSFSASMQTSRKTETIHENSGHFVYFVTVNESMGAWNDIKKKEQPVLPTGKKSTGRYNVVRVTYDGHNFDSISERERYIALRDMQKDGKISDLTHHVVYTLMDGGEYRGEKIRPIEYEADFVYREGDEIVVEDVKSTHTVKDAQYIIKKKMFKLRYPQYLFREYISVER